MLIMQGVVILGILLHDGVCFLDQLIFPGKVRNKIVFQSPPLSLNIGAMSQACSEIHWLRGLLAELGFPLSSPTPLHADNTSAIHISTNLIFHERTKHIEVDCNFIREAFKGWIISFPHASTNLQATDIFTKALTMHRHLTNKLMLVDTPHQFEGESQ